MMKWKQRGLALLLAVTMMASVGPVEVRAEGTQKEQVATVNFALMDSDYIEAPGTQQVVIDIDRTIAANPVLQYKNCNTGTVATVAATAMVEGTALFELQHKQGDTGVYEILQMTYNTEKGKESLDLKEAGVHLRYGVNCQVNTEAPDLVLDESISDLTGQEPDQAELATANDLEMSVVTFDAAGNVTSQTDIADALENAQSELSGKSRSNEGRISKFKKDLILVLDPGHGGSDPGACRTYNGVTYKERDIVLKIANYCKEELEKYNRVKIYMTRTDNTSPLWNRQKRCEFAKEKGADAVISFHINSTLATVTDKASGCWVYCPYGDTLSGQQSRDLADQILNQLEKLGLKNNGKMVDEGLGMVLYPKQMGFPGILIEHAFVSNPSDVSKYLSSAEQLKKLGVADAKGIAKYYGLTKGKEPTQPDKVFARSNGSSKIEIGWEEADHTQGYELYRATKKTGEYSLIATIEGAEIEKYADTQVKTGSTYYYKIRSYSDETGKMLYSQYSEVVSASSLAKPVITEIQSETETSLKLNWEPIKGATRYQIYRSDSKNGTYKKIKELSSDKTSYTDATIENGVTYYYKIRVKCAKNGVNGYSSYSSKVLGQTLGTPTITELKASDSTQVKLIWDPIETADSYRIYRKADKEAELELFFTTSETMFLDTNVESGKKYSYLVQACRTANKVLTTGNVSLARSISILKKVGSIEGEYQTDHQVRLIWKKVSGAAGYQIYRSERKTGGYKKIATIKSGSTVTYNDATVVEDKTYYYKIRAYKKENGKTNYFTYSSPKKVSRLIKPVINGIKPASESSLKLEWNPIQGATDISIYRSNEKNGKYKKIATVSGTKTSYTDKKVQADTIYYYRIRATRKGKTLTGYSRYSAKRSGTT